MELTKTACRVAQFSTGEGWTTRRHAKYATTDISVFNHMTKCEGHAFENVAARVVAAMKDLYQLPDVLHVESQDLFVVKYESLSKVVKKRQKNQRNMIAPNDNPTVPQNRLDMHYDGTPLSFIVGLTDTFEGGRTTFEHSDNSVQLGAGDVAIFAGGMNRHGASEISSGRRIILTGFLQCQHARSWRRAFPTSLHTGGR